MPDKVSREAISVGGRQFEPAHDVTFRHHIWMMNHVYAAGLHEPAENQFVQLGRLLASGRIPQLLAGAMLEIGVPWTPEGAEKTAEFFGNLTDQADINALDAALMVVIANFFPLTGSSLPTSPSYSPESEPRNSESAEVSTSATGPSSSESSPVTIPNESSTS